MAEATTPYQALLAHAERAAPFVTWYDDVRGTRIELSVTSLANAIAKAAGLLRDEYDVAPGDVVGLDIPMHWQRAAWLGACWSVGAVAAPWPRGAEPVVVSPNPEAFAHADVIEIATDPLWLPARAMPDVFVPASPPGAGDRALRDAQGSDWTAAEVLDHARALADRHGLQPGARVLAATSRSDAAGTDAWLAPLALPLVVSGSVVLVSGEAGTDRSARLAAERITDVIELDAS